MCPERDVVVGLHDSVDVTEASHEAVSCRLAGRMLFNAPVIFKMARRKKPSEPSG